MIVDRLLFAFALMSAPVLSEDEIVAQSSQHPSGVPALSKDEIETLLLQHPVYMECVPETQQLILNTIDWLQEDHLDDLPGFKYVLDNCLLTKIKEKSRKRFIKDVLRYVKQYIKQHNFMHC